MFELRDYQKPHYQKLLQYLLKHRCALDASETGTGKTAIALALCKPVGATPLVVSSKASRAGWEDLSALSGVPIEFVNYEKIRGRRTRNEDGSQNPAESEWLEEKPWGKGSFLRWKNDYEFVIFDEVHRCGGPTSLNSKALIAAKRQCKYVLSLSATAADDPRQMKALGFAIDQHTLSRKVPGRKNWMAWLLSHGCTPGVFSGFDFTTDGVKQKRAFLKMHEEIFSTRGARMRKSEIPNFPKTLILTLLLTPEGTEAVELSEKLHSLSDRPDDLAETMNVRRQLELLKIPFFLEKSQECLGSGKVVIFVNFTETLTQLKASFEKLGLSVGLIWGGQVGKPGEDERRQVIEQFQANKLDVLLCNTQAGSESLNAHDPTGQVERFSLISPCDSGRRLKQTFGRVNRDGGAFSTQYILAFKDTYEEVMTKRLEKKLDNLDALNDADLKV